MPITRDEALEHVGYEWRMFCTVGALLEQVGRAEDPVRDALIESLVLHARNLAEFLFHDGNGRAMREVLQLEEVAPPAPVDAFLRQANQHVMHLSPSRIAKRDWDFADVSPCFVERIDALRAAAAIPAEGWEGDRNLDTHLLVAAAHVGGGQAGALGVQGPRPGALPPLGVIGATGPAQPRGG